ncbi:MAG: thrombospondin type 3 repeat-containing protein, partial [Pseudobdellovibrionaceae bacterium]
MTFTASQKEISHLFASTRVSACIALILTLISCGKVTPLDPLEAISLSENPVYQVQMNFCTPPPAEQKQYLKTIIILDHSGSNQQNYKMSATGDGSPDISTGKVIISTQLGTDPKGLLRYGSPTTSGTLLNYLGTLAPNDATDPTRFFALVDFNSTASTYPASSSGFTSDIPGFYNHVYDDAGAASGGAPNDTNGTDYLAALTAAYNIMDNDIQNAKNCAAKTTTAAPTASCPKPGVTISSSYVIVFMSDGSPITAVSGFGADGVITGTISLTKESNAEILAKVGAITDLKANDKYVTSINMHTIYYYYPGNVDTSGQSLLAEMAKAGNGLSYNALSGSNIDYSQFQPPKKQVTYTLSDVFVTNASAVWWTDGKYHADTDGDGLPDDIEKALGTDPKKYSTANNGVSDLIRYRLANGTAINYKAGACSGIASSTVGGVFTYKSSDPNGLNDCEKLILSDSAGIGSPDS